MVQSDTATELQVATANGAYLNSLIQDISNVNYPAISSVKSTLCSGDEQGQVLVGPGCIVGLYHRAAALCHICESWCLFFLKRDATEPQVLGALSAIQSLAGGLG